MEHITASCIIRSNQVYKGGRLLWEAPPSHLPDLLLSAYQHFGFQYPKFYKMDHLCKLAWLSTELLLSDALKADEYQPEEIAVVLSNANSSLDTDYRYFATVSEIASPALFVYTLPNIMIGEICIRHHFKGENALFIMEAFDAAFVKDYVSDLLDTGKARACICGWVDVLGDDYSAALFLVERKLTTLPFTAENMNNLFNLINDPHE